jgi:hypothetical protein
MDVYTKFIAEVKDFEGEIRRVELVESAWDLDGEQVGQLLRQLMAAMGFTEQTIASVFGDDCECYSEVASDPFDGPPRTLREVFDYEDSKLDDPEFDGPKFDGLKFETVIVDDPCCCCDECCSDTACLVKEEQDNKGQNGD